MAVDLDKRKDIILLKREPNIKLDSIVFDVAVDNEIEYTKTWPSEDSPIVQFETDILSYESIRYLKISTVEGLPTLHLEFDKVTAPNPIRLISEGATIQVLFKVKETNIYKSVRLDFDISSLHNQDGYEFVTIYGVIKLPNINNKFSDGYGEKTSYEVLEYISKDFNLGFATNIKSTDDKMMRFCPGLKFKDYVNSVVETAWVSEKTFLRWFIDIYYNFNYIDLNAIANGPEEPLIGLFANQGESKNLDKFAEGSDREQIGVVSLSNHIMYRPTNSYVVDYEILDNSGYYNEKEGFFTTLQYFTQDDDIDKKEEEEFNPDNEFENSLLKTYDLYPLNTEKLGDTEIPLKGELRNDRYLTEHKYVYTGRTDLSNVHTMHKVAEQYNKVNNVQYQKIKLKVRVHGINTAIYQYQKIPVFLFASSNDYVKYTTSYAMQAYYNANGLKTIADIVGYDNHIKNSEPGNSKRIMDVYASGYYIVESIDYIYENQRTYTEFILLRREWPATVQQLETQKQINNIKESGQTLKK